MKIKVKVLLIYIIIFLMSNFLFGIYSLKQVKEKLSIATGDKILLDPKLYFVKNIIEFNFFLALILLVIISFSIKKYKVRLNNLISHMSSAESGEINLEDRAAENNELEDLVTSFNNIIKNNKIQADASKKISEGDFNADLQVRSDNDISHKSFNNMLYKIKEFNFEIEKLVKSTKSGKLNIRADYSNLNGKWRESIIGINEILDAYTKPIRLTNEYVKHIAEGSIPNKITEDFYGDFNYIKENINACIDAMNLLLNDTEHLISNAIDGKLSVRSNSNNHKGDYREVIEGLNSVLSKLVEPLDESADKIKELSKGNLSASMQGDYKGDYHVIKESFNKSIKEISNYIIDIISMLDKISNSDLSGQIKMQYSGDFEAIEKSINLIINVFNGVLLNVNIVSDEVSTYAMQLSNSSDLIKKTSLEGADTIKNISRALDHIVFDTNTTSKKASGASKLAESIKEIALTESNEMSEMLSAMKEIEESSKGISEVIKVIDEIAFQTNILAFRASIEASRAGEFGKAFSLLAEDVKELALRSSKAASSTTSLIELSVSRVREGLYIANKASEDLEKMLDSINDVSDVIIQVANEIDDQLKSVTEINRGLNKVSNLTNVNTKEAYKNTELTKELLVQASELKEIVNKFILKRENKIHLLDHKSSYIRKNINPKQ